MTAPKLDITTFLVASIHDMKNSISVTTALLEDLMQEAERQGLPIGKPLGQMFYESQRVSNSLMQLVSLYTIDQQFYPFDPKEYSVQEFAEEALARIAPLAQNRGITVQLNCAPELFWFFDRELLFSAVIPALHNGLRYAKAQLLLSIEVTDGLLVLRVEDDGAGYPLSMLEEQTDATPAHGISFATGSTGLGLYFSSVIARMHRNRGRVGSTRLENGGQFGGGVFLLTLP